MSGHGHKGKGGGRSPASGFRQKMKQTAMDPEELMFALGYIKRHVTDLEDFICDILLQILAGKGE